MAEQDIGAARVHLIVDASDFASGVNQARNTASAFGRDAEAAFNKSSDGIRRAVARITDYIAALKSTDGPMERQLRQLARLGANESIIKALASAWTNVRNEVQQTADAMEEAQRINAAFNQQRAANAQRDFNALLGVNDGSDTAAQARRRADAEAAILPLLQQEERAYEAIYNEALRINAARDEHNRLLAQQDINALLGVDTQRSGAYLAEQQRVVAALTQQFNQMDAAIEQAFAQDAEIERFRRQLVNLQETAGKTHYELLQLRADRLGVGDTFRPMIKAIQDQDKAMGHASITAKQYEWAMRGLPAQITDIAVSLASGQPAYLVMLQQGGQLKDMFGGIGPAARAVGSAVLGMINPITIAAAVVGTLGIAWYQGQKEAQRFNEAMVVSGNIAGMTVDSYAQLAQSMDYIAGVTTRSASAALATVGETGAFTAEQIGLVATAAEQMRATVGKEVPETVAEFRKLGEDPVAAIVKLNEQYHFLDNAIYQQIEALKEQGREQEAATLAMRTYAEEIGERTMQISENLGLLEKAWKYVKIGAAGAWDAMLGIGRADTTTQQLEDLYKKLNALQRRLAPDATLMERLAFSHMNDDQVRAYIQTVRDQIWQIQDASVREQKAATRQANQQRANDDAISFAEEARQYASREQKREREIIELRGRTRIAVANAEAVGNAELARQIQADADRIEKGINEKYKPAKGRQGRDGTQAIRDAAAAELAAITTQTKLLQSQYEQRQVTVEDYYNKLRGYAGQELEVTLRSIEAQKAAVAGRQDAAMRTLELESQAARAREQNATRLIELSDAERKAIQQREIAYRDYVRALDDANKAAQRSADLEVARIGMGSVQYNRLVAINEVMRKRAELEDELNRRVADGNLNPADAQRYRDALEKVNEQINIMVDGYRRVDEAQQSFFLGAQGAWQDWLEQTRDVAGQGRELMTSALEGFSSATADALNGNLKSFDNFFENIHVQILNFIVRQQLTKWLESLGEAASGAQGEGIFGTVLRGLGSLLGGGKKADTGAAALTGSAAALTGAAAALTSAAVSLGASGAVTAASGAGTGGGSGWIGTAVSLFSDFFKKNAKGDIYGGNTLAAYRNSIVSQPTVFPFAKGGAPRWGLMGEAGKEGIFPLARTASGDLGVRVVESQQSRGPTNINQQFIVQGTPDRSTREQMARKAGRESQRAMART